MTCRKIFGIEVTCLDPRSAFIRRAEDTVLSGCKNALASNCEVTDCRIAEVLADLLPSVTAIIRYFNSIRTSGVKLAPIALDLLTCQVLGLCPLFSRKVELVD